MTLSERFWKKVTVGADAECWPWIASRNPTSGYGQISVNGRPTQAHRIALQLSGVDVPPRTPVHHICENRGCVNPAHLELLPDNAAHAERHHRNCGKHGAADMRRTKTGKHAGMRYCGACNREKAARISRAKRDKGTDERLDALLDGEEMAA